MVFVETLYSDGLARRNRIVEKFWRDFRFSARSLSKRPGFTLVAILTLALGIGANVAIFSTVYGVLLRPLPYPQPDRLTVLWAQ